MKEQHYKRTGGPIVWRGESKVVDLFSQSNRECDERIKLNPRDSGAWSIRGQNKKMEGFYEEAIEDLDEAIRVDPKNHTAWANRGDAKRRLGRYREAIVDCDKALRIQPNNGLAYMCREEAQKVIDRELSQTSLSSREEDRKNDGESTSLVISHEELKFGEELGRGGFGIVYKGKYQSSRVAIKTLLNQDLNPKLVKNLIKEGAIMASLRSNFIVPLLGICIEKPNFALVLEYMPNGTLTKFLHEGGKISWEVRYQIGIDVGKGMVYLHRNDILHCDLKSLNILLDKNNQAKISDFGLSKVKLASSFSTVNGGSTAWMAPELFEQGAKGTKASDVFSYGIVLWELGARKYPFAGTRREAVPEIVRRGEREKITKDTPPLMAKLIANCWDGRADKRPKMKEAVEILKQEKSRYTF